MLKRYYVTIFFFLLTIFFAILSATATEADLPLLGIVIAIDAGHGGRDPGTMYGNIYEKDINLAISKKLEEQLLSKGAIVYQVREEDEDFSYDTDNRKKRSDLLRRIKKIEDMNSDLYLSIHVNWYENASYHGAEVLYYDSLPQNKIIGNYIMEEFIDKLGSTRHLTTTDLYMYQNIKVPGVLIECGFLSNPNERENLLNASYQEKIAKAITSAIVRYYT